MNPNDRKLLVREKALQNWRVPGAENQVRALATDEEFEDLIVIKLREEADEVGEEILKEYPRIDEIRKELGDLLSVMRSTAQYFEIPWEAVERQATKKDDSHGTFNYPNALVWDRS